jgi:hypothetical protein
MILFTHRPKGRPAPEDLMAELIRIDRSSDVYSCGNLTASDPARPMFPVQYSNWSLKSRTSASKVYRHRTAAWILSVTLPLTVSACSSRRIVENPDFHILGNSACQRLVDLQARHASVSGGLICCPYGI